MSARCSRLVTQLATGAGVLILSVVAGLGGAEAGTGDSKGTVAVPATAQCGGVSGTAVLMIPGAQAGFRNIPALLVTSSTTTGEGVSANLFLLDPSRDPATLVKTIVTTVMPANCWGALALRADKGDLLACTVTATGTDVYSI